MSKFAKTAEEIAHLQDTRLACLADIRIRYDSVKASDRDRGDGQAGQGHFNWSEIMAKHPTVPRRHFFTMVAKVKAGTPDSEILRAAIKSVKQITLGQVVPVAPSPNIIATAENAQEMRHTIDFMSHVDEMLDDVRKIRDWALADPDDWGEQKIKNVHYFMNAVRLKCDVLGTALKGQQEFYDLRKMSEFYDTIIEEIGRADPDTQRRILDRLNALNNERGFTVHARV